MQASGWFPPGSRGLRLRVLGTLIQWAATRGRREAGPIARGILVKPLEEGSQAGRKLQWSRRQATQRFGDKPRVGSIGGILKGTDPEGEEESRRIHGGTNEVVFITRFVKGMGQTPRRPRTTGRLRMAARALRARQAAVPVPRMWR